VRTYFLVGLLAFSTLVWVEKAFSDSQTTVGVSALASASPRFNCRPLLRYYRRQNEVYLGALWASFGRSRRCWKRVIALGKPTTLQIYATNENCRKKGNCFKGEFLPTVSVGELERRTLSGETRTGSQWVRLFRSIRSFCDGNLEGESRCLLALGLESQWSRKMTNKLVELAAFAGWSSEYVVTNPSINAGFQGRSRAGLRERHVTTRKLFFPARDSGREIITLDGVAASYVCNRWAGDEISEEQLRESIRRNCRSKTRYFGLWCPEWQGLSGDSSVAPPPRSRKPSVNYRSLFRFHQITREEC
jgi:hypothetical protein